MPSGLCTRVVDVLVVLWLVAAQQAAHAQQATAGPLAGPSTCRAAKAACQAGSANSDCCAGLSCHPLLNSCLPVPRQLGQPCITGNASFECDPGTLSCDPVWMKCYDKARLEAQPCTPGDAANPQGNCAAGLFCETLSRQCVKPNQKRNAQCKLTADFPCDAASNFTCHPLRFECFKYPREADDPCTTADGQYDDKAYTCIEGTACEVGITNECQTRGAKVGDTCHATRECLPGFSCHPHVMACYHSPRKAGEPCTEDLGCEPGLQCDLADTGACLPYSKYQEDCHTTRLCQDGLSCQPGYFKCYSVPRKLGEPCDPTLGPTFNCAEGLVCDSLSTMTCLKPAIEGEGCWATRPCDTSGAVPLYCEPSDSRCYYPPRREKEPCGAGAGQACDVGLTCHPDFKQCVVTPGLRKSCFTGPDNNSLPCTSTLECVDGWQQCFSTPRDAGQPCLADTQCKAGLKCGGAAYPYCVRST